MAYRESYGNAERAFAEAIGDEFVARDIGKTTGTNVSVRSTYQNLGTSSSEIVKAQSGSIFALTIYSTAVSTRWIQLYDSNQGLIDGSSVPTETYPVFAGNFLVLDSNYFGEGGLKFDEGITFAFSNISGIYSPASEDFEFHLKYI